MYGRLIKEEEPVTKKPIYYIYLSKELVNEIKPYVESYAEMIYGIPYEVDEILCRYKPEESAEFKLRCVAKSRKAKIPIPLDKVGFPTVVERQRFILKEKEIKLVEGLPKELKQKIEDEIIELYFASLHRKE